MLEMMEDEAGEGAGSSSQENLEQMMESEMRGGTGAVDAGGAAVSPNVARLMDVNLMVSIELGRAPWHRRIRLKPPQLRKQTYPRII